MGNIRFKNAAPRAQDNQQNGLEMRDEWGNKMQRWLNCGRD
jgi:hypothetical protein